MKPIGKFFACTCIAILVAGCSKKGPEGEYIYQSNLYFDSESGQLVDLNTLPPDSKLAQEEKQNRNGLGPHSLIFSGNEVQVHYPGNSSEEIVYRCEIDDHDKDGLLDIGYMFSDTKGFGGYVIDDSTVTKMDLVYRKVSNTE